MDKEGEIGATRRLTRNARRWQCKWRKQLEGSQTSRSGKNWTIWEIGRWYPNGGGNTGEKGNVQARERLEGEKPGGEDDGRDARVFPIDGGCVQGGDFPSWRKEGQMAGEG